MKKIAFFALGAIAFILPAIALAQYSPWTSPSANPPGNNPSGPVWLQSPTSASPQSGAFWVSGSGTIGDNLEIRSTANGKAINFVPEISGIATLNMGSWTRPQITGYTLDVYGDLRIKDFDGAAPFSGRLVVPQICLNNTGSASTNCITSWPSSGGGGDLTAVTAGTGITVTNGTGPIPTVALDTTYTDERYVNVDGDSMISQLNIISNVGYGLRAVAGNPSAFGVYGSGGAGGGHFVYSNTPETEAKIASGIYGVAATGTRIGLIGSGSQVGVQGKGMIGVTGIYSGSNGIGGYFSGPIGVTKVATENFGIWSQVDGPGKAGASFLSLASDGYGVLAYGGYEGGKFSSSGSDAHIARGGTGLEAHGTTYGVYGRGGDGARFEDSTDSGFSVIGNGNVGIYSQGSVAGITAYTDGYAAGDFYNSDKTVGHIATKAYSFWGVGDLLNQGNVGINEATPDAPLHVTGGSDAKVTNGSGYFIIGDVLSTNLVMDNNEIMARDNGASSMLHFQPDGGTDVTMFNNVSGGQIRFQPTGRIGIGTTSPAVALHVQAASDGIVLRLQDSDGICNANPESGSVTWTCSSDIKLKTDIRPLAGGLDVLMRLKPSTFKLKANGEVEVGFIAQEVQEVLPDIVSEVDEEGTLGFSQDGMVPYMVRAIQELKEENNALRERIEKLEAEK